MLQDLLSELVVLGGFVDSRALQRGVVCTRNEQTEASNQEQAAANFANRGVKLLPCLTQAAYEETESKA